MSNTIDREIQTAMRRVGSSAKDAGVGFDELVAAVNSIQQTTVQNGSFVGNILKTIFTRAQRS